MRESEIIKQTKIPNTVKSISEGLRKIGVKEGDVIIVHSSLSSFGWVCGGAQAIVESLFNVVGKNGTIVMPSQSGDLSDPINWCNPPVPKEWIDTIYKNMPAFNKEMTPSRSMGKVVECFRALKSTERSEHPQVSFVANGVLSKRITESHPLTPQFGINSPLGKLYNLNAKVLLLGVGYNNCTSFHLAESLIDNMPKNKVGTSIMENGERVFKYFYDYEYDSDDFDLIGEEFEIRYNINKIQIGNAQCRFFNMKLGVDFARDWILRNRFCKYKININ